MVAPLIVDQVARVRIPSFTPKKFKEKNMKTTVFENIWNKEKFTCPDPKDVRTIDGIDYLRVFKYGTNREVLIKKESLRKVKN